MTVSFAWGDLAAITMFGSTVAGVLFWALLGKLQRDFVTRREHTNQADRISSLEEKIQAAPDHKDFGEMRDRLSVLSREIGEVKSQMTSELGGVRELISRVDRMVELQVKFQMEKEARS